MTNRPIGDTFQAKVVKLLKFGAIVEFDKKDSALLHISEVRHKFLKEISDALQEGQMIWVEIIDKKENKTFVSMKNVSQFEKKVSFEDKIKNFLDESNLNQRQIQKSQDKKRGLYKKSKLKP